VAVSRFAPEWSDEGEGSEESVRPRPKRRKRLTGWKAFLRDVAVILVAAIVISFLIKTFLIRSFYIPSESMEDTLVKNDRIIVNELEPRLTPISRGDVVVFTKPDGWLGNQTPPSTGSNPVGDFFDGLLSVVGLTAPDSDEHLIKRVIGLPGDHVKCCNSLGQMTINGVPVKEPYLSAQSGGMSSATAFDVTVPEGSLWVMGDNRVNSCDSRCNTSAPGKGFVPEKLVVGRAILISWPSSRWTWLDNYPIVFADVDKQGSG
jgi:signal peptidase I